MSRVVLLGATGFTGELTARALVRLGARPVLAGRSAERLRPLAAELGGLETAVVGDVAAARAVLGEGDVLVNTVGPFARHGAAAIGAAVEARATYLDCGAEPAYVREVFERHGPRAEAAGVALLTALGYESVPGNLAAALALREAGPAATSVAVGYFATGEFRTSAGTRASLLPAALAPSYAFRGGRLVTERSARRVRTFDVGGDTRAAVSTGMAEHFVLPRLHPGLREVDTYIGWFGRASRAMQVASVAGVPFTRVPALSRAAARLARSSGAGPDAAQRARAGSHVVALAGGARVDLTGVDGYDFTANVLAWAATRAAAGEVTGTGALGPVEAFGLDALEAGVAGAGLTRRAT